MNTVAVDANDALAEQDACALAADIASGNVSASEVVDAAIVRLNKVDPVLYAAASLRLEQARREAVELTPSAAPGKPFAGVPTFIKDNTDLVGLPTGHGSRAMPLKAASKTGDFAKQLLGSGLLALGKTKLPEFGIPPTVEYTVGEPAHNPWHTDYSTGGSSGGSAALVAAGVVPIAHANDGGGSIRIPAACCGLVGLKPSRGRVKNSEMAKGLPINIVADGVLTRTVRDTATFFAAAEQHYRNPALPELGRVTGPGSETLRIGFTARLPDGGEADPQCAAAMHRAAGLCVDLGHHAEEMTSPLSPQMGDDFMLYYSMICAALHYAGRYTIDRDFQSELLEPITVNFARHFRRNMLKFPAALRRLKRARSTWEELMAGYDLILTPTLGHPPPKLGYLRSDLPFEECWQRLRDYAAFTPAANAAGTPAISLPMAMSEAGLPIGVQFAAGFGQERRLLELAFALEQAAPWPLVVGAAKPD